MQAIWQVLTLLVVLSELTSSATVDRRITKRGARNTGDYCRMYGYPSEQHEVETKDGYTLTVFRIPWGVKNNAKTGRIPVVVQHGIILDSDSFVLRGPEDFVFLLAEEGFDVWLSNTRGTQYSKHNRYSRKDYQFFNYTIDELAGRDLPAVIDYVLDQTKQKTLAYVGHSRGCMMPTMLLASQPEYNQKIHMLSLIAPVVYMKHAKSPFFEIAGPRTYSLMRLRTLEKLTATGRVGTVLEVPSLIQSTLKTVCTSGTVLDRICPSIYFFINGVDFANVDYKIMNDLLPNIFAGMSLKEMIHLLQLSASGKVQRFNYRENNINVYGTDEPPLYNISGVKPPVYIYYAQNDLFIDEGDLNRYIRELPNFQKSFKVPYRNFNHLDYMIGLNTNKVFIPTFLEDIRSFHEEWRKRGQPAIAHKPL